MIGSPEVFHRQSLENANAELARVKRLSGETAWLRLACFVGIVAGVVLALKDESHGYILAAASLILFLAAVKRYVRLSTDRKLLQIRVKLHGSELDALQGNYAGFDAGSRFIDHAHSYSFDLDVFGEHSLFNQVCRTVTPGGANRLAALMESPVSTINVLRERQEMVNELVDNHEFCIAFRVAGGGIGKTEKEGLL